MANALIWSSISDPSYEINQSFFAFRSIAPIRAKFVDWLQGHYSGSSNPSKFGWKKFNASISKIGVFSPRTSWSSVTQTDVFSVLEGVKDRCEATEAQLYDSLGIPGGSLSARFEIFKQQFWNNQGQEHGINDFEYWFQKHLEFLTGRYQRLLWGGEFTQFQQLMNLVSVELESASFASASDQMSGQVTGRVSGERQSEVKRWIRKTLLEAGILVDTGKTSQYLDKNVGGAQPILIPAQSYGGQDEAFIDAAMELFYQISGPNSMAGASQQNIADKMEAAIFEVLKKMSTTKSGRAGSSFEVRFTRTNKNGTIKTVPLRRMQRAFVRLDFKGVKALEDNGKIKLITDNVMKYFEAVRNYALSEAELMDWKQVNKGGKITKKLRGRIETLVKIMIRGGQGEQLTDTSTQHQRNNIMGFFGELAALGKAYYNISLATGAARGGVGIQVESLGALKGRTGKESATDLAFTIKNKRYGIQVKNPFDIDTPYQNYDIADTTLSMGNQAAYMYKNILNLTDEQIVAFETLVLNLYNTTDGISANNLIQEIKYFLAANASSFGRYEMYHGDVLDDILYQNHYKEFFTESERVNNTFFVIKGMLVPSSQIAQAILYQCQSLMGETQSRGKKTQIVNDLVDFTPAPDIRQINKNLRIPANAMSTLLTQSSFKDKRTGQKIPKGTKIPLANLSYPNFISQPSKIPAYFRQVNFNSNVIEDCLRKTKITPRITIKVPSLSRFITR